MATPIERFLTNGQNIIKHIKEYWSASAKNVTLEWIEANGKISKTTYPNIKKQIEQTSNFINNIRSEFVGSNIIPKHFIDYASFDVSYGEKGNIVGIAGKLIHEINADNYKAKQSDFKIENEIKATFPRHPLGVDKRSVFDALMVDIKEPDEKRHFSMMVSFSNIAPFSRSEDFFSSGSVWVYFSRDAYVDLHYMCTPEYPSKREMFIDNKKFDGFITKGWHKLSSYNKGHNVAWYKLDILRVSFNKKDNLSDLRMVITHPAVLVNTELSAVARKIEEDK